MKGKASSLIVILTVAILCFASAAPVFAVPDDSINSQHVTEADGTSGQDTNSGMGIKTGHIQNGAVTESKIADGSVTTGKIADSAITDSKILGPISATKISSAGLNADTLDGVHATDLAPVVHNHSIMDITGLDAILGTKADVNHNHNGVYAPVLHGHSQADIAGLDTTLAGKADTAHNHDGVYQKKYENVVVVAKSGGDFTSIQEAFNSINPGPNNRYLIKVMPGTYTENISVQGKGYFHLQGAGKDIVTLSAATDYPSLMTIGGCNDFEISGITFSQSFQQNMVLITSSTNVTFRDNSVKVTFSPSGWMDGIYLSGTSNVIVSENSFSSFWAGIEDAANNNGLKITGNTFSGAGSAILGSSADIIISGNTITGAGYGMQVCSSSGLIENNTITSCTMGILSECALGSSVIRNNLITGNSWGVYFLWASAPNFRSNNVFGNYSDIYVCEDCRPVLTFNTFDSILNIPGVTGSYNVDSSGAPINP